MENMEGEKVGGLGGGWELDQGNEVNQLGEAVHCGEDSGVSITKWETCNKILCKMGQGMTGYRQGSGI